MRYKYCKTNWVFKKHLNIVDVNNDERIRFIAGCHGLEALEKKVDENNDSVAFSIFPSSISDVITVANKNLTMPPKSTWFDPKPLDGLVVYEFEKSIWISLILNLTIQTFQVAQPQKDQAGTYLFWVML